MARVGVTNNRKWTTISLTLAAGLALAGIMILRAFFRIDASHGNYTITKVTLSSGLIDREPVDSQDIFAPSDTIYCTVRTKGVDGIVGMRWYLANRRIYEAVGETHGNTISSYIRSTADAVLPEGDYRVEIFLVRDPFQTVDFKIRIRHPSAIPSIAAPSGHRSIEIPWYPEIAFAFDEVWKIGDSAWSVNEVKIVLKDDTQEYFVAIVVDTDMQNVISLNEAQAQSIARPIALYAVDNHYIDRAMLYSIDGKHYDLERSLYVNLINPTTHQVYRVRFEISALRQ